MIHASLRAARVRYACSIVPRACFRRWAMMLLKCCFVVISVSRFEFALAL